MKRLLLVRHAATTATSAGAFPADETLDGCACAGAAKLAETLPMPPGDVLSSPAQRCLQTAAAAGFTTVSIEPALLECDFGTWTGRTLQDLGMSDPDGVAAWMSDPVAAPHGGESLAVFSERVGEWLDEQAMRSGPVLAITHGGVIKASLVGALEAPLESFWQFEVAPLSITELHAHDGRWTISRVNCSTTASTDFRA